MEKTCPKCSYFNKESYSFCHRCGEPLGNTTQVNETASETGTAQRDSVRTRAVPTSSFESSATGQPQPAAVCPYCLTAVTRTTRKCPNCGSAIVPSAKEDSSQEEHDETFDEYDSPRKYRLLLWLFFWPFLLLRLLCDECNCCTLSSERYIKTDQDSEDSCNDDCCYECRECCADCDYCCDECTKGCDECCESLCGCRSSDEPCCFGCLCETIMFYGCGCS